MRLLGLTLLAATLVLAKPNFSGTWKLDTARSDFGPMPTPQSQTMTVKHEDPALNSSVVQVSQSGNEMKWELTYSTDGKETTNTIRGSEIKTVASWEGDTLVFKSKLSIQGNDVTIEDKWKLTGDGKVLESTRHIESAQGSADLKSTYVKE